MKISTIVCLALCLLVINNVSQGMEDEGTITLPPAATIKQRLHEMGLNHFLEKTKFDQKLGGEKRAPEGVVIAFDLSMYDYAENLKGQPMARSILGTLHLVRPKVIKAILQEHPQAFKQLEDEGYFKQ